MRFGTGENREKKSNEKVSNENIIEESKFKELLAQTAENLKGKTYRLTKTEMYFSDRNANSESVTTNILEIVQPNKRREVQEIKSAVNNSKTENIWDGENLYERVNDVEWKKYIGGINSSNKCFISGKTTTTYKFVGKETVNDKTADVYETESHILGNKSTRTSQYREEDVTKTKYWISDDGLFLKTIQETEIVGSKELLREISIYEYDSSIKIEAPIKEN